MGEGLNLDSLRSLIEDLKDVIDWFSLGLQLGIKYEDLKKIELGRGVDRCKIEMLRFWLQNDSKASYKKLAKALTKIDRRNLARAIRSKYCNTEKPSADELYNPSMRRRKEFDRVKHTISSEDSKVKEEYAQFMTKLQKLLIKKKVHINDIMLYFVCLEGDSEHEYVLNATDIPSFMQRLQKTQSWLNFGTTASIACAYGLDDGIKLVESYEAKLKVYLLRRITLSLPKVVKAKEIVVKIDEKHENYTKERVVKFTDTVVRLLQLEPEDFVFLNVEEGCVKLTYLISSALVGYVRGAIVGSTSYLEENGVMSVGIDGETVWPPSRGESSWSQKGEGGTPKPKRFKIEAGVTVVPAPSQKIGQGHPNHPKSNKRSRSYAMRSFQAPITHVPTRRSEPRTCTNVISGYCINLVRKRRKLCIIITITILLVFLFVILYTVHGFNL